MPSREWRGEEDRSASETVSNSVEAGSGGYMLGSLGYIFLGSWGFPFLVVRPPVTLVVHSLGDLDEAGNVGTGDQAGQLTLLGLDVLLGGGETDVEGVLHDALQLGIDLLGSPGQALAVLGHLKTGDSDTTAVGGLARSVPQSLGALLLAVGLEDVDGVLGAAHVGALSDDESTSGNESLSLLLADLVLGSRGESNVDLADVDPGASALEVGELAVVLELGQGLAVDLDIGNSSDVLGGEAGRVTSNQGTLGVGEGDDGTTELNNLEGGVLGNVSGAGDGDALALESATAGVLKHVANIVDETEASGLRADQGTTPGEALAGEDTLPAVADGAVGTEEVTDLAATNTDITSGDIGLAADVAGELLHESLAEAADLSIRLALGVEVGTTLATTHVH